LKAPQESMQEVAHLLEMITTIRTARSKMDVPPKVKSKLYLEEAGSIHELYLKYKEFFAEMTKIEATDLLTALPADGTTLSFKDEVFGISFELTVDVEAKKARLELDKTKCKKEIEKAQQKLASPSFIEKAPAAVVEQEKQRLNDYLVQLKAIEDSLLLLD
jgi:valyl-tRNA synthetase